MLRYLVIATIAIFLVGKLAKALASISKSLSDMRGFFGGLGWAQTKRGGSVSRYNFCWGLWLDIQNLNNLEAWRDESFTDLEAEVEADGGYYESWLAKRLGRRSTGQRKVGRLIDAIRSSTEDRILLLGEPGSGKSVAVRHLAMELARDASQARKSFQVPLYVNLRGMPPAPPEGPDADFVRAFVRKEAGKSIEAATYIEKHWDEYIEQGSWFFIFDSFDEIPDVLHAGSHSTVILQYAEAVRGFVEGKPRCRAVVASREFKGPAHLTWEKFRILPLSVERQEELIMRSNQETKLDAKRIRDHVAATDSPVYRNPMFLTLLCQAMSHGGKAPKSDYDLLHRHINQLIHQGEAEVDTRWNIRALDLKNAALRLAQALACNDELGLSPSFDELARHLCNRILDEEKLESVLAALVFVKVLRSDVVHAARGDRRFAFAHRRYQEALVVEQLASQRLAISSEQLLTDVRWREYVVTLIQSQSEDMVAPVLKEANDLVNPLAAEILSLKSNTAFGENTHFALEGSRLVSLLNLLQEGLRFRPALRSDELADTIGKVLSEFSRSGDLVNRHTVLSVSGLMPHAELENLIRNVVLEPSTLMTREAYGKVGFLPRLSDDLGRWLRMTLANSVLEASLRSELRRIEMTVFWMPVDSGATVVWRRCLKLHRLVEIIYWLLQPTDRVTRAMIRFLELTELTNGSSADDEGFDHSRRPRFKFAMLMGSVVVVLVATIAIADSYSSGKIHWMLILWLVILGGFVTGSSCRYVFRSVPVPLFSSRILQVLVAWHRRKRDMYRTQFRLFLSMLGLTVVGMTVLGVFLYCGHLLFGSTVLFVGVVYAAMCAGGVLMVFAGRRRNVESRKRIEDLLEALDIHGGAQVSLLLSARTIMEARCWLEHAGNRLFANGNDRRAFANWLVAPATPNDWRSGVRAENLRHLAWKQIEKLVNAASE